MSRKPKLTKNEEAVVRFLYERRDADSTTSEAIAKATGLSASEVQAALTVLRERGLVGGPPALIDIATEALQEIDPKFSRTSEHYAESVIVAAAYMTKADEDYLAAELGFDQEFVRLVGSRLRASGVWVDDRFADVHLAKLEEDGLTFWMLTSVASGFLAIVGERNGDPLFQMTEAGQRHATNLGDAMDDAFNFSLPASAPMSRRLTAYLNVLADGIERGDHSTAKPAGEGR